MFTQGIIAGLCVHTRHDSWSMCSHLLICSHGLSVVMLCQEVSALLGFTLLKGGCLVHVLVNVMLKLYYLQSDVYFNKLESFLCSTWSDGRQNGQFKKKLY